MQGLDLGGPDGRGPDPAIEPGALVPPQRQPPDRGPATTQGPPTIPGLTLPGDSGPGQAGRSGLAPRGRPGGLLPLTVAGLAALARRNRREAVAVILLGVGGLFFPLPFWFVGAGAAALSRFWEARAKWLALLGPLLFTLVLSVPVAAVMGGSTNFAAAYLHSVRVDTHYLIRAGCLVTAVYLAWLVRRGPRVRVPPWRR